MPLSVAVALVECDGALLLIRRARGAYADWWALPGGKIEDDEHVAEAAEREIREEAGLQATFERHLGVVSEHLVEEGDSPKHFLLHVCALSADTPSATAGDEGELRWMEPGAACRLGKIVPSDRAMIEQLWMDSDADDRTGYYECVLKKTGDTYALRTFR